MNRGVFYNFKFMEEVPHKLIEEYRDIVPDELLMVWERYGFGSLMNGFLKVINPKEVKEVLSESYFRGNIAIPIFATGMGDIIVWEEDRYLRLVNYRRGGFKGISAGFEFFSQIWKAIHFVKNI